MHAAVTLAIVAILAACAIWRGRIADLFARQAEGISQVNAYRTRFALIHPLLRTSEVAGYVTDVPPHTMRRYLLARYYLSPARLAYIGDPQALRMTDLSRSALATPDQCRIIVGDFADPSNLPAIVQKYGLVVEKDFGNGVVLLRNGGR